MMNHGGELTKVKSSYPSVAGEWLDLSTGVSPFSYPVTNLDMGCLYELPSDLSALEKAAAKYYDVNSLLMTPGSMWSIKHLPVILKSLGCNIHKPVLIPKQGFSEHRLAWMQSGFDIEVYTDTPPLEQIVNSSVCVLINPNNPTGHLIESIAMQMLVKEAEENDVFLVVDEAFMDMQVNASLTNSFQANWPSKVMLLKSFGKFFGMPGIRLGALIADQKILDIARGLIGPWAINSLALQIGVRAYSDYNWQDQQKIRLQNTSEDLFKVLSEYYLEKDLYQNGLFITGYCQSSIALNEYLLQNGIYARLLDSESGIRFGLPKNQQDLFRLKQILVQFKLENNKVAS